MKRFSMSSRLPSMLGLMLWLAVSAAVAEPGPKAGTLISQTKIEPAPAGTTAWRIRYRSIAENGTGVEVSGVVVVPQSAVPKGGRDVVTWAHATVGIAEACAPSTNARLFENIAGLPEMMAAGYIVTATDFQGLGTPGPHPYLVGISSGRALLDAVRAARALPGADASKRYVIWGESQGAHAALWAAQLAKAYAPELQLLGVAAAAPPTDLVANFDKITNPLVRGLMTGFTSDSWSKIYGIDLATFANAAGRLIIHHIAKNCVQLNPIAAATDTGLLVLSRQLPQHLGEPWTKPLHDNSLRPMRLDVPMLVAQGSADPVVVPAVTHAFVVGSCQAGNAVRSIMVDGGDHTTIAVRSKDATLAWIADRFAGKQAPSDCGGLEEAGRSRSKI